MYTNRYCCTILLLLLLNAFGSKAQTKDNTEFNIWWVQPGDTFRVLTRMANVRSEPEKNAPILDSLACGTPVIVGQQSGFDELKGIHAPWIKVKYTSGGSSKEGYMWLGMLALGDYSGSDGNCFLYGIDWIQPSADKDNAFATVWHVVVKVLNSQLQVLHERKLPLKGPEASVSAGKLLGDMGLQNLKDIFRINFGGEACGIPTYYYYYGWNGQALLDLPGKMEVGDAGVFYHTETLLFPKEQGGKPGNIIRLTVEAEADEDGKVDKNGEPVFKEKRSREVYRWDGLKARKQ